MSPITIRPGRQQRTVRAKDLSISGRSKATTDQILPDRSEKSVTAVLAPVVAKDAVLVTDGDKAFGAFADNAGILHIGLIASKGDLRKVS